MRTPSSKSREYSPLSKHGVAGAHPPPRDHRSISPEKQARPPAAHDTGLRNLNITFRDAAEPADTAPTQSTGSEPFPGTIAEPIDRQRPVETSETVRVDRDRGILAGENWLVRNGHSLTYAGLYLFSILVLFRPYEIVPGLGFLAFTAFYFAIATLAIYFPSQLVAEGNLTILSTEIKAILAMTVIALVTIPIAKDPKTAWDAFNEPFIKAVVIFVVMVNVVRTRRRLMAMMWLSFGIGIYLGYTALSLYSSGKFAVEEYRVAVDVGGLFGNPNDMALHFVMMTPLTVVLAIAAEKKLARVIYVSMSVLFIGANMVTFSRGGFLGLMATAAVLAWKLGRKYRAKVTVGSIIVGGIMMVAAPGNYGLRMISIFIPSLDPVGSSDQRRQLLERSILVTLRNPWGIGVGNFPIVGMQNHQTHNAFTQVSSELGILGLVAYLYFIISPFRKLSAIERTQLQDDKLDWYYYLSVGLQASIIGYLVSSFFASVAYNWFIYYLIAYAVAFRRLYNLRDPNEESVPLTPASTV